MLNSMRADTSIVDGEKNQSGLYDIIYDKVVDIRLMAEQDKTPRDNRLKQARLKASKKTAKVNVDDDGVTDIIEMYKILQKAGILDKLNSMIKTPK